MASQPWPGQEIAPAPQQRRPIPRVIEGPPRAPPPQTGAQAEGDRLQVELQRERLRREQLERDLVEAQRPGALRAARDPAGDAGVDQRRTAGFYLRALRANEGYDRYRNLPPRGVVGQNLADAFPNAANALSSEERQQAEALQRNFIGALLRYESGAAIPPSEFETQARIFFPQPGDSPATIALKAEQRRIALEGLQRSAGQAATGIDPAPPPIYLGRDDTSLVPPGARANVDAAMNVAFPPSGDGPPNDAAPTDPNQVQPGESMGQVGNLPIVPNASDGGRNEVSGEGGPVLTDSDRRIAGVLTALANSRLSAERAIEEANRLLQATGRNPLTPEAAESIRAARRNRSRHPGFSPTPSGTSEGNLISRIGASSGGAAAIGYLDAASLGLPGLVSEDYREGVEATRRNAPIASTIGSLAGAVVAPGGVRPGMGLLQQSGRSAGQGFVYGLNSSGGDIENALVGGGIGGALPGAFNVAGRGARGAYRGARNFLARPGNYDDEGAQAIVRALNEEGVPGSRPLVDPASRDRMAYLESSLGTGEAIRAPLQATREAIEARAARLGEGGTAEELGTMGQRVQEAGQRYIDRSRNVGRRMYDRAAQLAGDTPVQGREAVQEIDAQLAALRRNPNSNSGEINFLEGLRRDFVDENGNLIPKTVGDIRDLRTGLRGRVSENNLTFSQVEGRVLGILGRAADDIERDLGGAAAPANRAYRRADRFYAERQAEIRQVISRVIGRRGDNLSGEQVMQRIRTMASNRGDSERLSRLWARLTPEEQLDAAATIAETAGRRGVDEAFSPAQFLNWSRQLSPSARQTIFGPEGARSIGNLARISEALQATERRLNNSRSGVVANWNATLRDFLKGGPIGVGVGLVGGGSALASGATGAALGAATSLAGMGLRRLSARSLMSPDLSRWLATAPRAATPSAIRRHIDRLQLVARANPAISQEVTGLRQALMQAVNDNAPNAGRLAASPSEGPDDANQ